MNLLYKISLLLLIIPLTGKAQEQLSLSQAIEKTLSNNYQIKIAEVNQEIAQNNNDWAMAGKYPVINFNLSNSNSYRNTNNPISFIPELYSFGTGFVPSVEASMTLFDGYRVRITKEQLEQLELQGQTDISMSVETSIQQTILAYYQALLQQEQVTVLEEVLQLSRDRIDYQQIRKEFGQAGTFDLLQTRDAYLNDSISYVTQLNTLQNSLRTLKLAMGDDDLAKQYVLSDELQIPADDYSLDAMKERMQSGNNNLRNAYISQELSKINTRLQETAKYPSVTVNSAATYDWSLSTGEGTRNDGTTQAIDAVAAKTFNFGVNFGLSYRIFDWGVRKTNIQNARLQEITAQYAIDDLKRNLNTELENTYATYLNQRRLVELSEELVANARQNLGIAEERFRGGQINSFDYRTVQLSYINATQSRLAAIFNLKATETDLMRLIGSLVR